MHRSKAAVTRVVQNCDGWPNLGVLRWASLCDGDAIVWDAIAHDWMRWLGYRAMGCDGRNPQTLFTVIYNSFKCDSTNSNIHAVSGDMFCLEAEAVNFSLLNRRSLAALLAGIAK